MRPFDLAPALGRPAVRRYDAPRHQTTPRSSRPLTGDSTRPHRRTPAPPPNPYGRRDTGWNRSISGSRTPPHKRELRPAYSAMPESFVPYALNPANPQSLLRPIASVSHNRAVMFVKPGCHYCALARALLATYRIDTVEIPLPDPIRWNVLRAMVNQDTVPQIWINGTYVGGYEDLRNMKRIPRPP
eukprot:Blabericola_migrator_1__7526@NODE_3845_length_1473_cov_5_017070_g2384_i0_p1_GENE_NODE_3845_length_1473_cov_5_017070_g2384_i0NODE_3845_length_1473_cov_5_017070_g2384_i0_p1_ORF_typecomplete_len186_score14_26Glutaredoxin/PF00462_24/3_7e10DUF836/PF05768_14/0_016_NODE_3845_length_1473_cov_5_017070_g2384_i0418975